MARCKVVDDQDTKKDGGRMSRGEKEEEKEKERERERVEDEVRRRRWQNSTTMAARCTCAGASTAL